MCEHCGCGHSALICPQCGEGMILVNGHPVCPACGYKSEADARQEEVEEHTHHHHEG